MYSTTRHHEFIPAHEGDLVRAKDDEPSFRQLTVDLSDCAPYPCVDQTFLFPSMDDLSTSAQPGGGSNTDPPEKLFLSSSSHAQQPSFTTFTTEHSEPTETIRSTTQPEPASIEPADLQSRHLLQEQSLLHPPSCHRIAFRSGFGYHMSPGASTDTTTCTTNTSSSYPNHRDHNHCYVFEQETMSWDEWNKLIQDQLAPWCSLLLATQQEESNLIDHLKAQFVEDFTQLNHVQKILRLGFLHGIELQENRHTAKLQELQQQQQQQLAMLHQTPSSIHDNHVGLPYKQHKSPRFHYGVHAAKRSHLLKRPWTNHPTTSGAGSFDTDLYDYDNHTVTSAFTTMSCRELSIERYQRSRTARGNYSTTTSPRQHDDEKKQQEVQRLLEELQQAEKRQKRLELQLKQAGVVLAEDIPYQEAKDQVERISRRMNEIGTSDIQHEDPLVQKALQSEYFRLEQDMEKFMNALTLTDEWMQEQQAMEQAWEKQHQAANQHALKQVRRHMPVDIRLRTRNELEQMGLPGDLIRKFQRTNVLQLLRRDPQVIVRWHPSNLEALRVTGLTLTERRALHHHLLPAAQMWADGNDPSTERKRTWFQTMRLNFKEALTKFQQHLEQTDGQEGSAHTCSLIGRQCPVRNNMATDYSSNGFGFPEGSVYEELMTATDGISTLQEIMTGSPMVDPEATRRFEQRFQSLREHYKDLPNQVQEVSSAMAVCEAMDSLMDRMDQQHEQWIIRQLESNEAVCLTDEELGQSAKLLNDMKRELSTWSLRSNCSPVETRNGLEMYESASNYIAELKKCLLADCEPGCCLEMMIDQVEPLLEMNHTRNLIASNHAHRTIPSTRRRKSRTEIMASLWKKESSGLDSSSRSTGSSQALDIADRSCRTVSDGSSRSSTREGIKRVPQHNALAKEIATRRPKNEGMTPTAFLEAICARRADV